jgi:hypothetical protein
MGFIIIDERYESKIKVLDFDHFLDIRACQPVIQPSTDPFTATRKA